MLPIKKTRMTNMKAYNVDCLLNLQRYIAEVKETTGLDVVVYECTGACDGSFNILIDGKPVNENNAFPGRTAADFEKWLNGYLYGESRHATKVPEPDPLAVLLDRIERLEERVTELTDVAHYHSDYEDDYGPGVSYSKAYIHSVIGPLEEEPPPTE